MTKRTLTILGIIAVTNLPISCDDGCGGSSLVGVKITELISSVGTFSSSKFSLSTSSEYDRAAINISISKMESFKISQTFERRFSIINSAYACSPPEPEPIQAIKSIRITSESAIYFGDQEYNSGENLVDLFKITGYPGSNNETTVNQFIEGQNDDLWIFGHFDAYAVFQLVNRPDRIISQKFTFQFEFSDLEVIEVKTTVFEVNN